MLGFMQAPLAKTEADAVGHLQIRRLLNRLVRGPMPLVALSQWFGIGARGHRIWANLALDFDAKKQGLSLVYPGGSGLNPLPLAPGSRPRGQHEANGAEVKIREFLPWRLHQRNFAF